MKKISSIVAILLMSLSAAPVAEAAVVKASNGKPCTIVGTARNDVLKGTSKADVICGLGGNDTITGGAGNDTLDGGIGNDSLQAGDGSDIAIGGSGADAIAGGLGNDSLIGDAGDDALRGDAGADKYNGGLGQNSCSLSEEDGNAASCQLLKDLGDLAVTISGQLTGAYQPLVGCYFWIEGRGSNGQIWGSGLILPDGTFTAQGFKDEIQGWHIGPLFGEAPFDDYLNFKNPGCTTPIRAGVDDGKFILLNSDKSLSLQIPELLPTTIAATNSSKKQLAGVNVVLRQRIPGVLLGWEPMFPEWTQNRMPEQLITPTSSWYFLAPDGYREGAFLSLSTFYTSTTKSTSVKLFQNQFVSAQLTAKLFSKSVTRKFVATVAPSIGFVIQ